MQGNVRPPNCDGKGGGTVHGEDCCYTESHPISPTTLSSPPIANEFRPSPELHSGGSEQEVQDGSDTDCSQQGLVGFYSSKATWEHQCVHLTVTVHSDASNKGWGAVLNGETQTEGLWSPEEATHHIN